MILGSSKAFCSKLGEMSQETKKKQRNETEQDRGDAEDFFVRALAHEVVFASEQFRTTYKISIP
jgi:hypothetical protein